MLQAGFAKVRAVPMMAAVFLMMSGTLGLAQQQEDMESAQDAEQTAQPVVPEKKERAAKSRTQAILAVSWQPGFCETRPGKPECRSQTAERYDASHFSLHGLWKMRKTYCGIAEDTKALDKKRDWNGLPTVALSDGGRVELARLMPGEQSGLEKHEWIKHGTCSGMTAEAYFRAAGVLVEELNGSAVQALFAANIGKVLREAEIKAAFDTEFGSGAGNRVKMRCSKDGERRVITGLTIGLTGDVAGTDGQAPALAGLIAAAGETKFNCPEGVVDAAGQQ